jgi:hypothetical protein
MDIRGCLVAIPKVDIMDSSSDRTIISIRKKLGNLDSAFSNPFHDLWKNN